MIKFILLLVSLFFTLTSFGSSSRPPIEDIVKFQVSSFQHQGQTYLATTLRHHEGWHTYWKNPGDSGLPTKIRFSLIQGENQNPFEHPELLELEWPTPKRYVEEGQIEVFGHSGDKTLFYSLSPALIKSLEGKKMQVHGTWLMCADICIPGETRILGMWKNGKWQNDEPPHYELIEDILIARLQNLPQLGQLPIDADLILARDPSKEGLVLYTNFSQISADDLIEKMNVLTPFRQSPLDFRREEIFQDKENNLYLKMPIDWDGRYQTPPKELPLDGKFQEPLVLRFLFANPRTQKVEVVEKSFSEFSTQAFEGLESFHGMLTALNPIDESEQPTWDKSEVSLEETALETAPMSKGLMSFLLFAFLGGLILNLMPCVLPVISLKLFSLIKHGHEGRTRVLKHNLSYTFGVLFTFWILATVVILLKSAGEVVGWGFQLQSPIFVALMALVIFVLGLNMFGLFEFATPGGSKLGNIQLKEGFSGDFFSGVLATILSTPCSAPFLGAALTFAFSSSSLTIFLVLTFVGLGLASPFLLTGFFPKLIAFLPRPGMWMDHFKKFLGLTLFLTTLWLLDVYSSLIIGTVGVLQLQTLLALIFFVIYVHQKMSRSWKFKAPLLAIILFLSLGVFSTPQGQSDYQADGSALLQEKNMQGLEWIQWSEAGMKDLAQQDQLVFIDFTAKWCLTCKVNEKLVIDTTGFEEMVEEYDIKLMLADWTRRDEVIGTWLKSQGLVGVPAYFIQRPDGSLINLGETLSLGTLKKHFKQIRENNRS